MTLKELQAAKVVAMKENNKANNTVLSLLIGAVQNATITPTGRVEATEELVNSVLIKQMKIVQEQLDTCPASRPDLLEAYKYQLAVIKQFAPIQITDEAVIREMILAACKEANVEFGQNARKIVMPKLKESGADMKTVNKVYTEMLANAKE